MKTKRKEKVKKRRKEKKRSEEKKITLGIEPGTTRARGTHKLTCRNFIVKTFEPY